MRGAGRRRSAGEVLLAAEALVLLAGLRVALRVLPVRRILRAVTRGRRSQVEVARIVSAEEMATALRVRWAVEAVSRNAPAEFVCFPQALAGYVMLRWRGVESEIVYGVARSEGGELLAHSWLTVGDRTVLGGEGAGAFGAIERWS